MEDELFDILDKLNIRDTELLLDKDINLSVDSVTRKRIEKSIMKKTGYYNEKHIFKNRINNILGGNLMKKKIALALSTAIILSLGGGGYAYAKTPIAYVSMDINPSIELGVSAFDKVVSVEAYNEDGKKVLEGTDLVNTNVDDAVKTVISNAISDGYIHEDGSSAIEITTATDKEKVGTELEESLKDVAEKTLNNNNIEAEVGTEKIAIARRDEARKLGITPGKLNLIQKLQELDPTINVEDYKDSSVRDIQKKTKELRKNNKSEETTTDDSISNDANADAVTEEASLSETSVDSDETTTVESEKNNNSSNNKGNKGNTKREENSNANKEKDASTTTIEKQNNANNVKSQENSNSSNSENSSNSNSKNNSNASKSNNSRSLNSENNDNNKNKGKDN